jgi:glycine hydroxymethyltransferase
MHTIAGIAYTFGKALKKEFLIYQKQIIKNSQKLAGELKKSGFKLYTNGTDNHLMIIDLKPLNLDGKTAENLLERANIIANRNSLPNDISPFNPTGIRLGTPAITSRKMKEKEMLIIANFFQRILVKKEQPEKIKKEVISLTKKFPLPYQKWLKLIDKITK